MKKKLIIIVSILFFAAIFVMLIVNGEGQQKTLNNDVESQQVQSVKKGTGEKANSESVDSIVVKLSRYDWECENGRLMTRYVFDYFFERIWEERGKAEIAFYTGKSKDQFVRLLSGCRVLGISPTLTNRGEKSNMCRIEEGYEDMSVVGKIEFFKDDELVNALWCSHKYMDGMERYNFPKRMEISKELKAEFDRIHNNR